MFENDCTSDRESQTVPSLPQATLVLGHPGEHVAVEGVEVVVVRHVVGDHLGVDNVALVLPTRLVQSLSSQQHMQTIQNSELQEHLQDNVCTRDPFLFVPWNNLTYFSHFCSLSYVTEHMRKIFAPSQDRIPIKTP